MSTLRYLAGVTTLGYDPEKCIGCGQCAEVCPHGVFALEEGKARVTDRDACMECGACARNCPAGALDVKAGLGCATGLLLGALAGGEPCCDVSAGSKCCG